MHILKQYPKLLLFAVSCIVAYGLSMQGTFDHLVHAVSGEGYVSIFFAGLLFSFGFTTPFAIAFFVAAAGDVHPLPAALIGGVGAVLSDMTIFSVARFTLKDELHRLSVTHWMHRSAKILRGARVPRAIRTTALWLGAGFVIASPLPDELGVSMLSGITTLDTRRFALLCLLCNTVGIFLILLAAQVAA